MFRERLTPPCAPVLCVADHGRPAFVGDAHNRNVEADGQAHDDREERREGVDVLVRIEMGQPNPFGPDPVDLRAQFPLGFVECHLAPKAGQEERPPRRAEASILFDEGRHAVGREYRRTVDKRQMGADTEGGTTSGAANGIDRCRGVCEQARTRENSSIVGIKSAIVHSRRQAEVIRIDNEPANHDRCSR